MKQEMKGQAAEFGSEHGCLVAAILYVSGSLRMSKGTCQSIGQLRVQWSCEWRETSLAARQLDACSLS
jgi:hypothetical protein